ncbi:MAG: 3-deoxy-manno-octulosonate cytidylyltransferase [Bacteroidota bacterium]|nr:3-deoxy-manno-octulosonate cytidylyltransferase [Bacteroidota bacterium]
MSNFVGIIPARYASSRFPGKPLAIIKGISMIQRVYEQAKKVEEFNEVIVATDNTAIFKHVENFGGKAVMTSETHQSGTDRCFEAYQSVPSKNSDDIIINIQGDEPFIDPEQIKKVISIFEDDKVEIGTLVKKIDDNKELNDKNIVKVIVSHSKKALWFSRAAIPFIRNEKKEEWLKHFTFYKHIGLYGYRASVLKKIVAMPQSKHETAESLEQLRWLDNDINIYAAETNTDSKGIDTYEDLINL